MEKLNELLSDVLGMDVENIGKIDKKENLLDYGFTSVDLIRLIVLLEEAYDIEFRDSDLLIQKFDSIGKIEEMIMSYKG